MATGGSSDGRIRIFTGDKGAEVRSFETGAGSTPALVFTGDGRHLVATHGDGTVRGWRVSDGREVYRLKTGYLHTYATSRDGRHVAFPSEDGGIGVLDTGTWKLEHLDAANEDGIRALAFHPRGRHLVSVSGDGKVVVRKLSGGARTWTLAKEVGDASHVAFSRDGTRLIVTSLLERGGSVRVFGVKR